MGFSNGLQQWASAVLSCTVSMLIWLFSLQPSAMGGCNGSGSAMGFSNGWVQPWASAVGFSIGLQQWQWFSNVQWFSIGSGSARAVVRQWAVVQQWAPHCCCCGASATGSGLSDGQWFSNGLQQWQGLEQWTVVQQWQWFSNGLMQWQGSGALMLWQPSGTHFGPAPCFSNGNGKMSYCSDAVLMPALHHATALDGCSGSF